MNTSEELLFEGWRQMLNQSVTELQGQLEKYLSDLRGALRVEEMLYITACYSGEYYEMGETRDTVDAQVSGDHICWGHSSTYSALTNRDTADSVAELVSNGVSLLSHHCPKTFHFTRLNIWTCDCLIFNKFILATMQSRVNDNYVVVAMRFQKKEKYIYIQIAEGKLETNGYISNYSWIEPTRKNNGEDPFEASFSIGERPIMALGDTQLPPEYILAGIKISSQVVFGKPGYRIGLYGVKFNYEMGKLDQTDEIFVQAPEPSRCVTQYSKMTEPRDPSQYTAAIFISENEIPASTRELLNFNAAEVLPNPLLPLGGVGVFYEIAPNNLPFLSLRLFAVNYMTFMKNVEQLNFREAITLLGEEQANDDDSSCLI